MEPSGYRMGIYKGYDELKETNTQKKYNGKTNEK